MNGTSEGKGLEDLKMLERYCKSLYVLEFMRIS